MAMFGEDSAEFAPATLAPLPMISTSRRSSHYRTNSNNADHPKDPSRPQRRRDDARELLLQHHRTPQLEKDKQSIRIRLTPKYQDSVCSPRRAIAGREPSSKYVLQQLHAIGSGKDRPDDHRFLDSVVNLQPLRIHSKLTILPKNRIIRKAKTKPVDDNDTNELQYNPLRTANDFEPRTPSGRPAAPCQSNPLRKHAAHVQDPPGPNRPVQDLPAPGDSGPLIQGFVDRQPSSSQGYTGASSSSKRDRSGEDSAGRKRSSRRRGGRGGGQSSRNRDDNNGGNNNRDDDNNNRDNHNGSGGNGNNNEDEEAIPAVSLLQKNIFACPFYKNNPDLHRDCAKITGETYGSIRNHVERNHGEEVPGAQCPRCKIDFKEKEAYRGHMSSGRCTPTTGPLKPTMLQLHEIVRGGSEFQRWSTMYNVLFTCPADRDPPSPYIWGHDHRIWYYKQSQSVKEVAHDLPQAIMDSIKTWLLDGNVDPDGVLRTLWPLVNECIVSMFIEKSLVHPNWVNSSPYSVNNDLIGVNTNPASMDGATTNLDYPVNQVVEFPEANNPDPTNPYISRIHTNECPGFFREAMDASGQSGPMMDQRNDSAYESASFPTFDHSSTTGMGS